MELKKAFEYLSMSIGYIFHNNKNSGLLWTILKLYTIIWLILACFAQGMIIASIIGSAINFIAEPSLSLIFVSVFIIVVFVTMLGSPILVLYLPIHYSYNHFVNLENMLLQEENRLNDKKRKFLSTINESENYDLIVSFASKYGLNYTKSDLENLNRLLQLKGMERKLNTCDGRIDFDLKLDLDTTAELIYNEVQKQECSDYKKRIFRANPSTKNDFLSVYLDMYGKSLSELQKFNSALKDHDFDPLLEIEIENAFKEMELELFEKRLTADENYKNNAKTIDYMSGYDFEHFVKKLFENMGYSVEHTSLSGDQGADLIATKFGEKTSVQVKRYSGSVSNSSVQEVVASKNYYNCDKCMVVTNSYFTKSAIELASANSVELINRDKLHQLIDRYM